MNATSTWPRNRLLLALPARNLKRLIPALEQIECKREEVLLDADSSLDHVFFPDSGVISVVAVYPDGSIIEMATIGREGCTGFQAFFGAKVSSARLFVQVPGTAAKMSRKMFQQAMDTLPQFRNLMQAVRHRGRLFNKTRRPLILIARMSVSQGSSSGNVTANSLRLTRRAR